MKRDELIKVLQSLPEDAHVVAEWDSGWSMLNKVTVETDDKDNPVIVFDVNEYGTYRQDR